VRLVEHVGAVTEDQFLGIALEHRPSGVNQNGRAFVVRLPSEPGEEIHTRLVAVQQQVQDDGIERMPLSLVDGGADGRRLDRCETLASQQTAECTLERSVVFDYQDDWWSCGRVHRVVAVVDVWIVIKSVVLPFKSARQPRRSVIRRRARPFRELIGAASSSLRCQRAGELGLPGGAS
jgi:hypothetical protein